MTLFEPGTRLLCEVGSSFQISERPSLLVGVFGGVRSGIASKASCLAISKLKAEAGYRVFLRKGVFGSQSALSPQREFVLFLETADFDDQWSRSELLGMRLPRRAHRWMMDPLVIRPLHLTEYRPTWGLARRGRITLRATILSLFRAGRA